MVGPQEIELTRNSYYEVSVTRPQASVPLAGRITADVCVVGGGYAGLSAALELAERGYSVALLEAQRVGWGASGRNGGQALAGFGFAGQEAIEVQLSAADARRAWDISVEALQLLHARIDKHAIECDYVPGHLSLAVNARKARALEAWVNHVARAYGYPLQSIGTAEVGNWIASERFRAGAFDPQSGHLHPLKYCLGLAAAARAAAVQLFENSAAIQIERGDKPIVKTAAGEVACRFVVLAGNVYLGEFGKGVAPELMPRIMPVGTYIITTEPMAKERADALIQQRAAAFDTNLVLDYFRVTADHRLLFGGGESYSTATPRNLAGRMRQRMLAVFPQLADLPVPYVWGGFVDITMNQAPDFGRLGSNIYYLQGFSGHGLAMAVMAGKLVAETIAGQAERFDVLSRIKHHAFPGGALLRTPALVLGMFYYRLRELL
ncbi:FAD-binding oxidoreductase [Sulfuricella sp.]|uniref:NAD(P)/FAD-dependent oxidoreductase n=1 Tax=Sulfuricella sp. TaxID=2099377 RepID=UPI002CD08F08|nr:FAD-binding oxidoreductase [Sulfuricella sp.]HUX64823.1 FAD-binding oxidoreductase [Sulfuricella sp.]